MSALVFKLLLHLCVWSRIGQANGMQNLRYSTRFDNNQWRFGKRQDFSTKSRFLIWKPPISPGQMYSHVKTPIIPLNYNRYSIQPPPIMAPIHQSYMFAIPTKINFASYQPIKEIKDNRKPGNLHHLTIINSIIPKPYLPTAPTIIHSTTPFQNYRRNNKQLYQQYVNNFGRQNMENFNKINAQQFQLPKHHQHLQQQQALQMILTSSPSALQMNKPTIEYMNVKNYNTRSNNIEQGGNELNNPISQCDRNFRNDSNYSASNVFYYYCNNRITNYKNPTQQQIIGIQPTTSTSSTTSTTTTEVPFTTTTKAFRNDFNIYTTEKPIFLPTPIAPLENGFTAITSTSILKNSLPDSSGSNDNFKLQRQKHKQKKFGYQPQSSLWYDDMERQQQYTTTAVYDNVKLHSFFTIEDAVTRSPDMQVFNDPYQAYKHARKQKINNQRQASFTTNVPDNRMNTFKPKFTNFFSDLDNEENAAVNGHARRQEIINRPRIYSTTKIPDTTTTTAKKKFKSFFDDLDDEDYIIPEAHQYDYSLFSSPQKNSYHKSEFKNAYLFPKHNQIIEHGHKANGENEFIAVGETIVGRPKIKDHHFGLFESIASTPYTLPAITTRKQFTNFNQLISTTHKVPFSSYKTKPITYTTTLRTVLGNIGSINEQENSTPFLNEILTTTAIPIATSTEKKPVRITFKPQLNPKSSTAFKYLKQRRVHKSYTNLTSTTTKAPTLLKKVPKYQRQYKTKKLKQFKHLYTTTTTSTTSTSTTTTEIPTTVENYTKRASARDRTSPTEEPTTTKKSTPLRSSSTTDIPKQKNHTRQQTLSSTEITKTKHIKTRTTTATAIAANNSPTKVRSARRGTKRANIVKKEDETPEVVRKVNNKKRRRLTSSSATPKSLTNRIISESTSTSAYSSTPTPVNLRTSATTTKSIMRISNSKPRTKVYKDVKLPLKTPNEVNDDQKNSEGRNSLKSISPTMANVPPLPIEIYFRKSHNVKI